MGHDATLELPDFLKRDSAHMNAFSELAGFPEDLLEARMSGVTEYFGLPTEGTIPKEAHE